MEKTKIKVAIIRPPLKGHANRGIGTFSREIIQRMKGFSQLEIADIEYGESLDNYDIVHYPYFDPFFLTLPKKLPNNSVITIHDLIPIHLRDHYKIGIKGNLKWEIQKRIAKQAKIICTDSEFSKEEVVDFLGIRSEKIRVVYAGVSDEFYKKVSFHDREKVLHKYHINFEYILYVGDINYNKNIPGLIEAFGDIHKDKLSIKLVLVGPAFDKQTEELTQIKKIIEQKHLTSSVVMLKYVTNDELKTLYQSALLYVQPSYMEGFGLPVLEAMASGCVVASSTGGSLYEIVKGCSFTFDPHNKIEMKETVEEGITNTLKRKDYQSKGLLNAKNYTWDRTAQTMIEIYKNLVNYEKS
jgi:glycosyltransferase involved in cell wall biosynthesis